MGTWETIADERRALADQLDGLTPEQWATPSLCSAWTVHDVAAHLVVPHVTSVPTFIVAIVAARGRFERANVVLGFLVSGKARLGFLSKPVPPVRLVATDADWSHGAGDEVRAPAAALALTLASRTARLDDLGGPGAPVLAAWARR